MQSWGHIDLESAKHWLSQRSPLIQDWGTSSLSLSQDMSSGDFQTAARQLLSVQVPFPEHDEHLRHALRIWGRRSDHEDNEAVTAIRQASHLSVDYQEKLINYVLHRQRYTFP